jgi:hypothetical protein
VGEQKLSHSGMPIGSRDCNSTIRLLQGACLLLLGVLCLLVGTPPASAAPTAVPAYSYSHSFATEGQLSNPFQGAPSGVGIEPGTGNVIVADEYNLQISLFARDAAPGDSPLTTFGAGDLYRDVAVDQGTGDVYASGNTGSPVRFVPDSSSPPVYTTDATYNPPSFGYPEGIAFDPTTDDLLVLNCPPFGECEVIRLDASGTQVSAITVGPEYGHGIAVASDGTFFVIQDFKAERYVVRRYNSDGESLGTVPFKGTPSNLAFDPITNGIDIVTWSADSALRIEGFTLAGEPQFEVPLPESTNGALSRGIVIDPESGRLYVLTDGSSLGIHVFVPAVYPGVEAPAVSAITPGSAHVSAEVDPGDGPPAGSYAMFEYSADGGTTWTSTPPQDDTAAPVAEADINGLDPNFKYLVRAAAGNDLIVHRGKATAFTTEAIAPGATTTGASDVTEDAAVLNGTVNPFGLQTNFYFEFGPTTAYGSRVPVSPDGNAGAGRTPRAFSRTLIALQPGTTYHYRVVAANSVGLSQGEDRVFTTSMAGSTVPRTYEQVTPVDKDGGVVDSGVGFQVGPGDGRISFIVRSPAGAGSPLWGRSISVRGGTDWKVNPVDPPMNATGGSTVFDTTLGISPDFTHAFVVTNRKLTPEGVEDGTNLYVVDLESGAYAPVASTAGAGIFASFTTNGTQNKFLSGSPDFSTIVFGSAAPLLPGVTGSAVYRWTSDGGLKLESTMPGGAPPTGNIGLPSNRGTLRSVSEDGNRVYFAVADGPAAGVYLNEDGQTRAISVSHRSGDPATPYPGEVLGVSRDGRYAFFSTYSGHLTEDSSETEGNIYRYDAVADEVEYLGAQIGGIPSLEALGVSDDGETFYFGSAAGPVVWRHGDLRPIAGSPGLTGESFVSPDGRYFAFWSQEAAFQGIGVVHLFDADTGELFCASCLSSGADPGGAFMPDVAKYVNGEIPAVFDAEDNLYFDTTARLVSQDTNGASDVYAFKDGKVHLITPGDQPLPARFADVSEDGRDVYFTTAQSLVGRDVDRATDIYDARAGGGLPGQSPQAAQPCSGESCTPSSAATPGAPANASETSSSRASLAKSKRAGGRCQKPKHPHKGKRKSVCPKQHKKKATKNRKENR